jgi:hypothetical protein
MDTSKFLELIAQSPQWLKWCIASWVLAGAVLAAVLFVFRPMKDQSISAQPISSQQDAPAGTVSSAPVIAAPVIANASIPAPDQPFPEQLSLESYYKRLDALEGRFLQKHEFIASMAGKVVTWQGFVHSVTEHSSGIILQLKRGEADKSGGVVVFFPLDFRMQVYSLQKKDHVRVIGTFSADTSFPTVKATELTVL